MVGPAEKPAASEASLGREAGAQSTRGAPGVSTSLARRVGDSGHAGKLYVWPHVGDADTLLGLINQGTVMPIVHLLIRSSGEPPLPCTSLSVPEYLLLSWKVSQRRSLCPLRLGRFSSPTED